jgi:hypothetical protein
MQIKPVLFAIAVAGTVSACGDTAVEQSLFGAGAGAAGAAVLDTNVAGGALVGAIGNVAYCQRYPSRC